MTKESLQDKIKEQEERIVLAHKGRMPPEKIQLEVNRLEKLRQRLAEME